MINWNSFLISGPISRFFRRSQCAHISVDKNASSFLAFYTLIIIILPALGIVVLKYQHWMLVGRLIEFAIRLAFGWWPFSIVMSLTQNYRASTQASWGVILADTIDHDRWEPRFRTWRSIYSVLSIKYKPSSAYRSGRRLVWSSFWLVRLREFHSQVEHSRQASFKR